MRAALVLLLCAVTAAPSVAEESRKDTRPPIAPDIRDDETRLKIQRGDFVVVPIPISNPTLDSGLVGGAAYFYPQTEEEKKAEPASLTALAGLYTSNDSRALVAVQQNYWRNGRWRFTGAIGGADLRLSLLTSENSTTSWRINGGLLFAKIARRIKGNWYGGLLTRAVDAKQTIEIDVDDSDFTADLDLGDVRSVGLGAYVEYDSRDMPTNAYSGRYFKFDALFNDESIGSNNTYQNYAASFRSYHQLRDSLVLAWQLQACTRQGTTPLWDACTLPLRGFSLTDYLGSNTLIGQFETRWQMSKRWGLVGFVGSGYVGGSLNDINEREGIPSYGAGVRFMVLPAKRVNIRLDFAWSTDSNAIHLSVGEAF